MTSSTASTARLGDRVNQLLRLPHGPGSTPSPRPPAGPPDEVVDVVVVGSGGAAMAAAAGALGAGAATAILEKGPVHGGTTACSGGVAHIYDNVVMRAAGIDDPRDDALAYMARVSRPGAYDPAAPRFGLLPDEFAMLEAYYDRGSTVMEQLTALGAADMGAPWLSWDGQMWPDYYEFPENKAVRGRGLQAVAPDGGSGNGGELIRQLVDYARRHGTEIRLGHRVVELTMDDGRVTGVVVDDGRRCRRIGARGGVVFGSGGFTHDPALRERLLRGPVAGGSGNPTNTGDLMRLAAEVGAGFGGTHNAWWNQQVIEAADDYANSVLDVWAVPGDGMILVNRFGVRAVDEKREYETRGRVHHIFEHDEYVNRVMFMIYDERTAANFGGIYPIPAYGAVADHVVRAVGLDALAEAMARRLSTRTRASMPPGIAPVALAPGFAANLATTVSRFNGMARAGVDDDFHRGEKAVEFAFHGPPAKDNDLPNALMHPIDESGPLYAIFLVGCAFETNSGPRTSADGQILDPGGTPIAGLYGSGNCVAGVFGEGYPGGGATIGPGMVFGFSAGRHAAAASGGGR
ncbi:MAG TPA: FAD-dependent oxidoreductase [Acidimicrobiales bacterium]|nr:FAD-dependent oxidoreductase [Acidimicrobiales bacterium]